MTQEARTPEQGMERFDCTRTNAADFHYSHGDCAIAALSQAGYAVVLKEDVKHLVDWFDSDCRYDHHGYCQEHTLSLDCPVPRLVAALDSGDCHAE